MPRKENSEGKKKNSTDRIYKDIIFRSTLWFIIFLETIVTSFFLGNFFPILYRKCLEKRKCFSKEG